MDMTHMMHPDTLCVPLTETCQTNPMSLVTTTSNLPDSTTESPLANPIDSLILQTHLNVQNDLQQVTHCHDAHMLATGTSRHDNLALESLKTLEESEVEAFRNLISDVSVEVDSTQSSQSLIDLPQFVDNATHEQLLQYASSNQQNLSVTQSTISQILLPELNKTEEKVFQNRIGPIDQCISRYIPDFSNYPAKCNCPFIDKVVPVEQIWVYDKQMYFLPHVGILVIGNKEYTGIFYDQNKGYIALGEVMEKIMPRYESDLIKFLELNCVDQQELTSQEIGYLRQRYCISEKCKYTISISLNTLRQMARFVVMYEGHKPDFNINIKNVADGPYYRKILQRHIRCGSCGGVIILSREPEEYVELKTESNIGKEDTKCFSVGYISAGGVKFVAFKTSGKIYISLKELCQKKVLKLQVLQARLQALRQRPRLAPNILNNYLNTPQYNVTNTMWIDIGTLRCVCVMGKCTPGFNAEVYSCLARVNFSEHIVTNIYGQDDFIEDKAVYTMDPRTFEVVMKKTSLKPKSAPTSNVKPKASLKSFELTSKQIVGYESPEKLNDSAFIFEKPDTMGFEDEDSSLIGSRKRSITKQNRMNSKVESLCEKQETYVFDNKDSAIDFLSKADIEKNEIPQIVDNTSNMKKKKDVKYIPGKSPTFRVRPAEKPHQYSKANTTEEKKMKPIRKSELESKKIQITMDKDRLVLTVNPTQNTGKSKRSSSQKNLNQMGKEIEATQKYMQSHTGMSIEKDETSNAVNHLVQEYIHDGEHQMLESTGLDINSTNENLVMTPRTETNILSQMDLNGSINSIFSSPSHGNVLVEMLDQNGTESFNDSTSPLSRLYQQYEQFETSSTVNREHTLDTVSETESSIQSRNEIEMPIDVTLPKGNCSDNLLPDVKLNTKLSNDDNCEKSGIDQESHSIHMHENVIEKEISNETHLHEITMDENQNNCTQGPHNTSAEISKLDTGLSSPVSTCTLQISQSLERERRAKTLSPIRTDRALPRSHSVSNLYTFTSLKSPVFKKTGEIDRTHAKVKRLTEMENESQPLDLLASLAEVITDESNNQLTDNDSNIQQESCVVSDENSNTDKVTLPNSQKVFTSITNELSESEGIEKIRKLIEQAESHVIIEPYKDEVTGHWKVRIKLKPGAKEALPGLFSEEVDKNKRNTFLALLGKLHITVLQNSILTKTNNPQQSQSSIRPHSTRKSSVSLSCVSGQLKSHKKSKTEHKKSKRHVKKSSHKLEQKHKCTNNSSKAVRKENKEHKASSEVCRGKKRKHEPSTEVKKGTKLPQESTKDKRQKKKRKYESPQKIKKVKKKRSH